MSRILKWLMSLVFTNFWWKLLSLAIAVALWAAVWSEPELSTFPVAAVEYRNRSEDLEFSQEPVSSVRLQLRGSSGELAGLGASDGVHPQVIIDLTGVSPGRHTFYIGDHNVKLPRGVRLEGAIPSEIQLEFDRKASRTVPVEVRINGSPQPGYAVVDRQVDPEQVTIVGPAGHVNKVTAAFTDPIDVSSLVGYEKIRVNAYVLDPYVRLESSPVVIVGVTVRRQ